MDKILYQTGDLLQGVRPKPDEMTRVAAAVRSINDRVAQAARGLLKPEDEPARFQALLSGGRKT